jgi:hypothetical protein
MKKLFKIGNTITSDKIEVMAETWWEAMDKAFSKWRCQISRHDMINLAHQRRRKERVC